MNKTAIPGCYPMPGTYSVDYMNIYFGTATPDAKVYYTLDGTTPTLDSKVFEPDLEGSVPILNFCEQPENGVKEVTVKAIAKAEGYEASKTVKYHYTFYVQPKGTYNYELLRAGSKDVPALYRINDYCRANMFLVVGSERALLIDGGIDYNTDILPLINDLTGGKDVDLFVTHGHLDHNAATYTFIEHGLNVYVSDLDIPTYLQGGGRPCVPGTKNIEEGDQFDLGNTILTAYFLPGHTPGGFVLLDEKTGDLFSSDELVNNDPWGPNGLLLNLGDGIESSVELYLERVIALWNQIKDRTVRVWTGHNIFSNDAKMYFEILIKTMQDALIRKEEALVPCNRPSELNAMVAYGDYKTDFCSFSIVPKYLTKEDAINHNEVKSVK